MTRTNQFLDIIPPGGTKSPVLKVEEKPKHKPSFFKKGLFVFTLAFISLNLLCHFVFCRAEINIRPDRESLNFTEKITIDAAYEQIDLEERIIPARYFEETSEIQQKFASSEVFTKNEKAGGIIKVYNEYDPPRTLNLIAGTRFLSSDSEKYFTSLEKIHLPAAKIQDGKVVPQWAETEIVAMEAGEDYNIGPTKFSIPGLVGTSFYYSTWGESSDKMSGGAIVGMKRVSEKDLKNAEEVLSTRLLAEADDNLRNKISSEFILLDNALKREIVNISSLAPVGAEVESFSSEATAEATALVFKKADLEQFAREFILSQAKDPDDQNAVLTGKKEFLKGSLVMNYEIESMDLEAGKIVLILNFSGKVYPEIDKEILKQAFSEKSVLEIKTFLENQPEITRSTVRLWPFWLNKAPENIEKINIELDIQVESYR